MFALQGGWRSLEQLNSHVSHSSHVSPISYTQEREGDGAQKEQRGEGEESAGWNLICFVHE